MGIDPRDIKPTFANGLPTVVVDLGHSEIKVKCGTLELNFPHAIAETVTEEYDRMVAEYGSNWSPYYMKWRNRVFVIGEAAENHRNWAEALRGRQRLTVDYYGVIMVNAITRLFNGKPPEAMNVFLTHPPADQGYKQELMKAAGGRWVYEVTGRKCELIIGYRATVDEIIGGAMNVALNPHGEYYSTDIIDDGPTVVVDLGGGTFDVAKLNKGGSIDYGIAQSERIGVREVVQRFQEAASSDKRFAEYLRDSEGGLPIQRVRECFMDEQKRVRMPGKDNYIEAADLFDRASAPLINQMQRAFSQMTRSSAQFNHALVTGGGGGLLYDAIAEKVLEVFARHDALHKADRRDQMIFANVRGGWKMVQAAINDDAIRSAPPRRRGK